VKSKLDPKGPTALHFPYPVDVLSQAILGASQLCLGLSQVIEELRPTDSESGFSIPRSPGSMWKLVPWHTTMKDSTELEWQKPRGSKMP
jgi:hypothetical protein